jgi:hypothetical protein
MMKTLVRAMSAVLAMMTVILFCACSNNPGTDGETTAGAIVEETTAAAETENVDANGYLKDNLPADLKFSGEEFTTLYWSDREHEEFFVEGMTGEIVNDALYTRNQQVEDRLGITLKYVGTAGNGSNIANFTNKLSASVQAGDHAYDMVGGLLRSLQS